MCTITGTLSLGVCCSLTLAVDSCKNIFIYLLTFFIKLWFFLQLKAVFLKLVTHLPKHQNFGGVTNVICTYNVHLSKSFSIGVGNGNLYFSVTHTQSTDLTLQPETNKLHLVRCNPLACHRRLRTRRKFSLIDTSCPLSASTQRAEMILTMETLQWSPQSKEHIDSCAALFYLFYSHFMI